MAGEEGSVTNFMHLFDEFLVWKAQTSNLKDIEVNIYQSKLEIKQIELDAFQHQNYILHDETNQPAEIT